MSATPTSVSHAATDLVFVQAYYNLPGIAEEEWLEYHPLASLQRLGEKLRTHVVQQLDLFSESYEYADYFSLAEYENPEDTFDDADLAVFRSGLGAENSDTPLDNLWPRDALQGFRAVMIEGFHFR